MSLDELHWDLAGFSAPAAGVYGSPVQWLGAHDLLPAPALPLGTAWGTHVTSADSVIHFCKLFDEQTENSTGSRLFLSLN